jgi:hypothetical protein
VPGVMTMMSRSRASPWRLPALIDAASSQATQRD